MDVQTHLRQGVQLALVDAGRLIPEREREDKNFARTSFLLSQEFRLEEEKRKNATEFCNETGPSDCRIPNVIRRGRCHLGTCHQCNMRGIESAKGCVDSARCIGDVNEIINRIGVIVRGSRRQVII